MVGLSWIRNSAGSCAFSTKRAAEMFAEDHALFNQLMRIVTLSLFDTLNTAFGIEDEFSFFTFK